MKLTTTGYRDSYAGIVSMLVAIGLIGALVFFNLPKSELTEKPLGGPDVAFDLLIGVIEAEQEQCLKDTGFYCQKLSYMVGAMEVTEDVSNGPEGQGYRIRTRSIVGDIITTKIHGVKPDLSTSYKEIITTFPDILDLQRRKLKSL